MDRRIVLFSAALVVGFFAFGMAAKQKFRYVGVKVCKMCHQSERAGRQFEIWQESGHARAFETLLKADAHEIAKASGIEDPQKNEACLRCHAVVYADLEDDDHVEELIKEGVTCESCHGPGSAYSKWSIMKAINAGKEEGEKYGLIAPTGETCVQCHNEQSPTFDKTRPFVFEKMYRKIAHGIPEP